MISSAPNVSLHDADSIKNTRRKLFALPAEILVELDRKRPLKGG